MTDHDETFAETLDTFHAEVAADAIDHEKCAPSLHTFDAGDPHYEGRVDEHGNQRCNDCSAPLGYCEATRWYFHAGADLPECFLVQDRSYVVAGAPEPGDHVYELEDGERICITHSTPASVLGGRPTIIAPAGVVVATSRHVAADCPAIDLAELVAERADIERLLAEHFADGHVHTNKVCPYDNADRIAELGGDN